MTDDARKPGTWLPRVRKPDRIEQRPWTDYHLAPYWGNDNEPGEALLIEWTNPDGTVRWETIVTDDYWSTSQR